MSACKVSQTPFCAGCGSAGCAAALKAKLAAAEVESARLAAEVNRLQAFLPDECAYPDTPGKIIARLAALLTEAERERDEVSAKALADLQRSIANSLEFEGIRKLLTEAREALEFYAEPKNWESILTINHFERAAAFPDETEHIDGRRVGGRRARSLLARLTPKEALPCICSWCQESIPSGVVCESCKDGLNGPKESEKP